MSYLYSNTFSQAFHETGTALLQPEEQLKQLPLDKLLPLVRYEPVTPTSVQVSFEEIKRIVFSRFINFEHVKSLLLSFLQVGVSYTVKVVNNTM